MSLFRIRHNHRSAPVARERLKILLAHERSSACESDLIAILRDEILSAISEHISIDPDKVELRMHRNNNMSLLEIGLELETPFLSGQRAQTLSSAGHPDNRQIGHSPEREKRSIF